MSANEYIVVNGKRYAAIVPVSYKADGTPNLDSADDPAVNTTTELTSLISGEDQTNNVMVVEQGKFTYDRILSGASETMGGGNGAVGDFLHAIIVEDTTGTIQIKDGGTIIYTVPAGYIAGGGNPRIEFNMVATIKWNVSTGGSTTECLCIGRFTA